MAEKFVNSITMQMWEAYLKRHGVPAAMIRRQREDYTLDALENETKMKYDRIYSGIALSCRRAYGFGAQRIMKQLTEFDGLMGELTREEDSKEWTDLMKELRDETGLVVRTDEENRIIIEYDYGKDEEEVK